MERRKSRITIVQQKLEDLNKPKEEVQPVKEEKVMVDTKGEIIIINGKKFAGKMMVDREISHTINRLVESRLDQRNKEKVYAEHQDKRGLVPGKVYR